MKNKLWYPNKGLIARKFYSKINNKKGDIIEIGFKLPFNIGDGSVLDIETTGLEPSNSDIVAIGYVVNNFAVSYQLLNPEKVEFFRGFGCGLVEALPKPIYAYSASFEHKFLGFDYGVPYSYRGPKWFDIMCWGEGESYYSDEPYIYRKYLTNVVSSPSNDISGGDIPVYWELYKSDTENPDSLFEIVYHNILDLIRKSYVKIDELWK